MINYTSACKLWILVPIFNLVNDVAECWGTKTCALKYS